MRNNNLKIKTIAILFFIFAFSAAVFSSVNAQSSPEFLTSWKARDYAPVWYIGKNIPIIGTLVDISFNLFSGGKPVNLSQNTVRWYVNGDLVKNENDGLGIKSLTAIVPGNTGDEMMVRISIIDYGDNVLDKTVVIPVARPEVAIDFPYVSDQVQSGSYVFRANPFFFNVSNANKLSVNWSTNGSDVRDIGSDPWRLDLNLNSQTPFAVKINVSVTVKNLLNYLELAGQNIILQTK